MTNRGLAATAFAAILLSLTMYSLMPRVGQNHIHVYGVPTVCVGRDIPKYTVVYGV
jgi:hypothetical protein